MSAWAPHGMGPGQVESVIKVESGRWSPGRAGARASPVPMLTLPIAELVEQGVITNPNYPNWSCTDCTQWKQTYHLCPASECVHCVCTVCSFWRRGRVRNCQFKNTSGLVRTKFGMDIMVNLQCILYFTLSSWYQPYTSHEKRMCFKPFPIADHLLMWAIIGGGLPSARVTLERQISIGGRRSERSR